jgi:hypothetical protein
VSVSVSVFACASVVGGGGGRERKERAVYSTLRSGALTLGGTLA